LAVASPRYDLIAIDLDGTLLGSDRRVSDRNIEALDAARSAGLRVAICTGRGLVECDAILRDIRQLDPVVVAGGSIVGCPVTRGTLHRFCLDPALVADAARRLLSHRHPVMVLKDPATAGYDYLMVVGDERHPLDPVTQWWLREMNVEARYCCRPEEDPHPEQTVRLGVCGLSSTLGQIMADLEQTFAGRATMHHFPAVVAPEHARQLPSGERLHILEVFAREASKWSAIQWLAARHAIPAGRICAIGDEINDLPMIARAGLGIAMGNAVEPVRKAAARQTLGNDEDGVAYAIERVLGGMW
jgi:hydroxymethylpyrimidine pyrophosphatase-like HAD family hydrolase